MTVKKDPAYENEYNCLTTDLVNGLPPSNPNHELGSLMYVWQRNPNELHSVYKLIDSSGTKEWFLII